MVPPMSSRLEGEPKQPGRSQSANPGATPTSSGVPSSLISLCSSGVPPKRQSLPPGSQNVPPSRHEIPPNISIPPGSPSLPLGSPDEPVGSHAAPSVLQRWENITKSESDKREYRALVLPNRMKVLLVSDRKAEMTAASLQVNVGYYSDPDELPGLAHFCEHMLFLGTEKHPEENGYEKFLSEHGGACNAGTGADYTIYHFNILPDYLGTCLDMFAQFFISPLFTESATERELNAVDSEHQNAICFDGCRINQLCAGAASPGHPSRKFGTGNRHTLATVPMEKGINVRQELLKFHRRWYSANIMSLTVVGKESLYDLEAMVVPLFLPVEDSGVEAPAWPEHPCPPALRRRRTYCDPIADNRQMKITFPIPDCNQYYPNDPCGYLTHLVGHEGPGSLLSALKNRGWCTSLWTCNDVKARGFAFFEIEIEMTEDGVKHTDDIVSLIFQYLAMLRTRKPQRGVWEERCALAALALRFEEPCEPLALATMLVGNLQDFPTVPMEDILVAWRMTAWCPELIEEILEMLIPENIRVLIVAKCFAHKCTQVEPWYGTKYLEEEIELYKIKEWQMVEPSPEFHMPLPNEFIPSRIQLETTDSTCESKAPVIVRDTLFMRLWFKQDNEFLLPKASIEFELNSPLPDQSPRNFKLTDLWAMLVEDSLQEATYAAGLAGLSWYLWGSCHSIIITINGFDDKQHLLLNLLMNRILDFKPDCTRFAVMKDKLIRELKNKETHQPYEHANYQQDICLSERVQWTTHQILDAVESLTPEMLEDFIPRFLRSVYVEGLVFGNLSKERALKLADIVESRIPKDAVPMLAQELLNERGLEIEKGGYYLREIENTVHASSCALVYLQVGVLATRSNVLLELLQQVLSEPCFNTLRTKEQLGYYVWCSVDRAYGVQGLTVTVQGDLHPSYLEKRIDAFLHGVQNYLEEMSEAEFFRHRAALASLRAERPKQINAKKEQMWTEIVSQMYNFDRARVEVDVLNTISKEELIQFYQKHISECSPERRKLSVHVVSTAKGGRNKTREADKTREANTTKEADKTSEADQVREADKTNEADETSEADKVREADNTDKQPTKITDLIQFKSGRRVYPRPAAFASVPPRGA